MRVALQHTTEVGRRAGRILLGERDLETLGIVDAGSGNATDPRMRRIDDGVAGYDVLVSDDLADPAAAARMAAAADIPVVLWADRPDERFAGANLASALAPALAAHEMMREEDEHAEVTVAWTEPGAPLRKGVAVPFPDPVGARWGRERPGGPYPATAVPVGGEWAGAAVTVRTGRKGATRVVGVADLATHVEALALAAAAAVVATGAVTSEDPWRHPAYLAKALEMGLEVAQYSDA